MKLIVGLDVGTTATKAALFNEDGEQIALGEYAYPVNYPRPGWAEQDPEELWHGVVSAIQQVVAPIRDGDEVVALSVSAQGATTILLDRQNNPVRPAISWMDQRAAGLISAVAEKLGSENIYYAAGWPLSPWLPLSAVSWLRQNEPGVFDKVRRLCFVDDFIKFRLCGEFVVDPSSASITGLFDVKRNQWQPEFLKFIGFDEDRLSRVESHGAPISNLTPQAAEMLELPQSTLVVNGAHDQICCVTAVGAVEPGQVMLGTGTAWVVAGVSERPIYDLVRNMCVEPHSIPGLWSPLRSQGGVGACVEWFVNKILGGPNPEFNREELYAHFNEQVIASPPGANGLIFLPPRGRKNDGADGGILRMSLSHMSEDMGRALMEGVACDLRIYLDEMRESGVEIDTLIMTGGATNSPLWPSIVADMVKVPIRIPVISQAGARGAAILASVGAGIYPDIPSALEVFSVPNREILPNQGHREKYDTLFARYQYFDKLVSNDS
jgi:xylulokinase